MHPPLTVYLVAQVKKVLTVAGKFCLPFQEKTAYRSEKNLLTVKRKKSLPCAEKTSYRAH